MYGLIAGATLVLLASACQTPSVTSSKATSKSEAAAEADSTASSKHEAPQSTNSQPIIVICNQVMTGSRIGGDTACARPNSRMSNDIADVLKKGSK